MLSRIRNFRLGIVNFPNFRGQDGEKTEDLDKMLSRIRNFRLGIVNFPNFRGQDGEKTEDLDSSCPSARLLYHFRWRLHPTLLFTERQAEEL